MKTEPAERVITEVVLVIRTHTVPARSMATLDLDKLDPDARTVTSTCRKVFLDRKVKVSIDSVPNT